MDAQEFLARVVAPGAYYAFAYKRPGAAGLGHKFFPQTRLKEAADWVRHTANECDVWHAVASFKTGRRTQANAEALRCFWYDADIKRDGDGKAPETVWANQTELVLWLAKVKNELPIPNVWISSGYGVHLYWVLDEAISAAEWLVHGKNFVGLLKKLDARGDIGISADSARILRPPETFNYKVPSKPAETLDITPKGVRKIAPTKFVTSDFLARLTPGVSPLGPRPANRPVRTASVAAAKANLSKPPPSDFGLVASRCLQVQKSLAEEGEHDTRDLWHLLVNLAYFCDNREAAHDIGRKWVGRSGNYSAEDTDAKFDQTAREHADKGSFGAPSCESFDTARRGVCVNCEFRGKIKGPYNLGYAEPPTGLPTGYVQSAEGLSRHNVDGGYDVIAPGILSDEQLFFVDPGFELLFNYEVRGHVLPVRVTDKEAIKNADRSHSLYAGKGITLNYWQAPRFSEFIVAWIQKLRDACMYIEAPPSFGWVQDDNGYQGIAIAGTYYRTDGTEGVAQLGDKTIHANYQPRGKIKLWRQACEYVVEDIPELQTIVGASFAAPLMELVGKSGILSVWSQLSGARKTSAFQVATAVWCNPITGMSALRDTTNSVQHSLAETKIMPVFWDEVHTANEQQLSAMVELFFSITQGRGKARLDPKIEQRAVGYWKTLLTLSSNKPNAEMIEQDRSHTNAGVVRLFEYEVEPVGKADKKSMPTVQLAEQNYGWAGREFISWVVQNLNEVRTIIEHTRDRLYKDVAVGGDERFYEATIIGIVTGAYVANRLGLVSLNSNAIYKFLKSKMIELQDKRQTETPADEGEILATNFEKFVSAFPDGILVTQNFAKPGPAKKHLPRTYPRSPSLPNSRLVIHIGLDEREMRVDYKAFKDWCGKNGQSYTMLFGSMKKLWYAQRTRLILGIGTEWATGKIDYVKIPLTIPELMHHLDWGTPAPSNVVPFPAAE